MAPALLPRKGVAEVIVYGHTPPWEGSTRYGTWTRGEELWDGSGFVWTWGPDIRFRRSMFSAMLTNYLKPIQQQLNNEMFLMALEKDERLTGMSAVKVSWLQDDPTTRRERLLKRLAHIRRIKATLFGTA